MQGVSYQGRTRAYLAPGTEVWYLWDGNNNVRVRNHVICIMYHMMGVLDGVLFQSLQLVIRSRTGLTFPGPAGLRRVGSKTEEGRSLESFADGHRPPKKHARQQRGAHGWVCSAGPSSLAPPPPPLVNTTTTATCIYSITTTTAAGLYKLSHQARKEEELEKKVNPADEMIIHTNSE